MKVKGIILMLHFLHSCSMYDSTTPRTTNGLQAEIPDDIPRIETSEDTITLPGLIAVICVIIIIVMTSVYCTIKKYCRSIQQSASIEVSQTVSRECFSTMDTNTINTTYPVVSYWTVYPSLAPPAYPTTTNISQSQENNVLPPRYSSIFDDNGQEIVSVYL